MHSVSISTGSFSHATVVLRGMGDYVVEKIDERNQIVTLRLSPKQRTALTNARIRWNFV